MLTCSLPCSVTKSDFKSSKYQFSSTNFQVTEPDILKIIQNGWFTAAGLRCVDSSLLSQCHVFILYCADTASVALSLGRDPVITCLHQLLEHLSLSIHLMPADLVEGDSNEAKLLLALLQGELDEIACEGSDLCKEFARRMSFINPVVPVLGGSLPSLLLSPSCSVQAAAFSTISK